MGAIDSIVVASLACFLLQSPFEEADSCQKSAYMIENIQLPWQPPRPRPKYSLWASPETASHLPTTTTAKIALKCLSGHVF